MGDNNHTNQHRKRHHNVSKSLVIERIQKDVMRWGSLEDLRRYYKDDGLGLYRTCLIFTTCTNRALCVAMGIPVADSRKYIKTMAAYKGLWKMELVYCPFTGRKEWTLSANLMKAMNCPGSSLFQSPQ